LDYRKLFVAVFLGSAMGVTTALLLAGHYLGYQLENGLLSGLAALKQTSTTPAQPPAPPVDPGLKPAPPLDIVSGKEQAWKRFYKPPAGCEVINEQNMVFCGEERLKARKLFEELFREGQIR
jgi:hypothetical protein